MTALENVELVVAWNDAYNAGDLDATMQFCAPDVEAFPDASVFPESGPLHGRDALKSWAREISSAWIGARWETIECYALGAERVLHRGQWGGKGVASGIETFSSITAIVTIRDGLIAGIEYYFDHDEALRAAGLEA